MLGTFKSLVTTLRIAFRPPVTAEYPTTPAVLASRFMAHPVLTWDKDVVEPYCTGCLVCMRICPTDCIDVSMKDNPKHASSDSTRRKIVDDFELNVADCIMCGLCVEYCNFDAIIMSDHFDASQYARPNLVLGLDELLEQGKGQEAKGRWSPPEAKKSARRTAAQGGAQAAGAPADDGADRVAASRARAAELRAQRATEQGTATNSGPTATTETQAVGQGSADAATVDPRVAESRRKVAELKAQRAAQQSAAAESGSATGAETQAEADGESVDPRVAEGRRRAAELRAQRVVEQGAATDLGQAAATETQATESGLADAVTVDPRVEEGRRRAAELRAQRAAERAAQESASAPSDRQDADGSADSSGVERE